MLLCSKNAKIQLQDAIVSSLPARCLERDTGYEDLYRLDCRYGLNDMNSVQQSAQ